MFHQIFFNIVLKIKQFLPKLEQIKSIITTYENTLESRNSVKVKTIKILSDKYSKTMKSLNISISRLNAEEFKTCIECIARFENLKELAIGFIFLGIIEPIDCLSLIGQKCNKLLKLDLIVSFSVSKIDRFFGIFSEFKAIKQLNVNLFYYSGMTVNPV